MIAPAPVAKARGKIPNKKERMVITMARKRKLPALMADSIMPMPLSLCSFANSTIRIAFFAARATSKTRPTCAKVLSGKFAQ